MKKSASGVLSLILCIVLVIAGLGVGAWRGWSIERAKALETLSQNKALLQLLEDRGKDAVNLAVVAARHLGNDHEHVTWLRSASQLLQNAGNDLDAALTCDRELSGRAYQLSKELPELESMQASKRDQVYLETLTRTLSADSGASVVYDTVCKAFNDRMNASLSGKAAMLLGLHGLGQ